MRQSYLQKTIREHVTFVLSHHLSQALSYLAIGRNVIDFGRAEGSVGFLIDTNLWIVVERGQLSASCHHKAGSGVLSPVNLAEIRFGIDLMISSFGSCGISEMAAEEGRQLCYCRRHELRPVVHVDVGRAFDDMELLRLPGLLIYFLTPEERVGLRTGDDEQWPRRDRFELVEWEEGQQISPASSPRETSTSGQPLVCYSGRRTGSGYFHGRRLQGGAQLSRRRHDG